MNKMMESKNNFIPEDLFSQMFKNRAVRIAITKASHLYFFHFYLADYVKYATAPFQKEIFAFTEDDSVKNLFIVACRGSGKSTIITTSYPLWAILGKPNKKFVLILTQTKGQAKQHMMNLRKELEDNNLLKNDLGPFKEEPDEWGSGSLVFTTLDARITVASTEQSIRGLRHGSHRPDLIICDDVEDIASTKTRDSRNKTYQWLTGEVIPAGDRNTKLVVIGNLLHEDSLLVRLQQKVDEGKLEGVFRAYPLLNEKDEIIWPGKYPTMEDIENERKSVGNENAWQREYLLKIIPSEDQVIYRDWIKYYDVMPSTRSLESIRIGIDLAISERTTADYTAMVTGWVFEDYKNDSYKIYIDPIIVNERMNFPATVDKCKALHDAHKSKVYPDFIVEEVGYQGALSQLLEQSGLSVRGIKIGSQDKRSRLTLASHRIKSGEILFPRVGCEKLLDQIVNFGIEKYDDLADAFTMLILDIINKPPRFPRFSYIWDDDDY